jgi:GrpB-like predicted nucleotidyltransferase (UPF0157 family)
MPGDEVVVVEYDEGWPEAFRAEALRLEAALPISITFQHVGSTSVPGLCAKPVIDILVGDNRMRPLIFYRKRLEPLGYVLQDSGEPGRYFFRKNPRTAHVHVVRQGSWDWYSKVWYRDLLRGDEAYRDEYASLKRDLALKHREDREAYSKSKDALVERGLRAATVPRLIGISGPDATKR